MSKYLSAPARSLAIPGAPKPGSKCGRCGWCFKTDNEKHLEFDPKHTARKRTQPRTEIHAKDFDGALMIRCTDCFEKELWHAGKHSKQQHDGKSLYREALKP